MNKPKRHIFPFFTGKLTPFNSLILIVFTVLSNFCAIAESSSSAGDFTSVDRLIENGITSGAYPSAVLVVGNSKGIIYQNAYGRLTYGEKSPATTMKTIYDLASVTKVIATTAAIMRLYDEGKIDLNAPVSQYIPEFGTNGKTDITVYNLLVHNSGLTAWTPFYQDPDMDTPQKVKNAIYNCQKEYETGSRTLYSDYNAFLLGEIVERISGKKLDEFCRESIFSKLNMTDTYFLVPMTEDYRIAPTENDTYWRKQLLVGYVHDELAAILEGVSGNAGLFSTGPDLFKFMQMMLNNGIYTDERRMSPQPMQCIKAARLSFSLQKLQGLVTAHQGLWDGIQNRSQPNIRRHAATGFLQAASGIRVIQAHQFGAIRKKTSLLSFLPTVFTPTVPAKK
ncbi:MAG TPA: serine hydrolase domain-containing protein [Ignavibacteria bacterium]|nr:serine hydrolase domain-containing protein [Ignavibacteria bacterium]